MMDGVFSLFVTGKSGALWFAPLVYPLTQWLGAAAGAGCARVLLVSLGGLWKNSCSTLLCRRVVRNWKSGLCLRPCIFQFLVCGCCFWSTAYGFLGRVRQLVQQWIHALRQYFRGFGRISHIFFVVADSNVKRFFSIQFEWRNVPSRCFGCSFALRGSHLETPDFFLRVSRVELHDDGLVFSPLSAAFFGLLFGVEALVYAN